MTQSTPSLSLLLSDAAALEDSFRALLHDLVHIESPTRDEEANLRLADRLEAELRERGAQVESVPAPGLGRHLVGRFRRSAEDGKKPLLVMAHMDTVHPVGMLERMPFSEKDGRLGGPGVYDMKSGIVAALMAIDGLLAASQGALSTALTFLITCDEEIGSGSSRELIEDLARESRAALVLEPSVPGGKVKTRRKGVGAYRLRVSGVAAHSGIEPEAGASAVHELVRQVQDVLDLARDDEGTTINVGVIAGGTKENVMAAEAHCTIDVRFWRGDEADRVDAGLRALSPVDQRCSLELSGGVNRYPLERTDASGDLFDKAKEAARELGWDLEEGSTGGGSDGNLASAVGCPTLDGLGLDGGGAHALHEHILVSEIPRRIALMAALFETL